MRCEYCGVTGLTNRQRNVWHAPYCTGLGANVETHPAPCTVGEVPKFGVAHVAIEVTPSPPEVIVPVGVSVAVRQLPRPESNKPAVESNKPFDRKAYQREYMRKAREAKKKSA